MLAGTVLRDHGHGLLVDMENLARASLAAAAAASGIPPLKQVLLMMMC